MKPFEASYENGLLKPAKPLSLAEGEHVRVIVLRKANKARWDLSRLAAAADEDLALASAGLDDIDTMLDGESAR